MTNTLSSTANAAPTEKPENGIAGLKHLRYDIVSGIVVSLVSLPLSSGIAIASGAPPIYGLISAIIAGLIFPFIGGAYMTISGPAAGLAPALMAIMISMGGAGDAEHVGEGYPYLIVVICMVGIVQIILAMLKLARFAAAIPLSVVEGMLASIGAIIIVKQIPMFLGYLPKAHAREFYEYVLEVPTFVSGWNPTIASVSLASLILLFVLGALQKKYAILKVVPPHLIAVIFGVILSQILRVGTLEEGKYLLKLPDNLFAGMHAPDFAALIARQDLWYAAIMGVITLTMIDGVESLATAIAIDRIDPFKRRSSPNRVLLAMGISNVASSLCGGLTIIPGGVKSKANIASGGRTLWANFTNAICLILYIVFFREQINLIPKCVLAAVLIYTGWKMCEPLVWRHMAHIGREQLAIFAFTIVVTLATDLLWGIVAGLVATFFLDAWLYLRASRQMAGTKPMNPTPRGVLSLLKNPVVGSEMKDSTYHIFIDRPIACFNSMVLDKYWDNIPKEAKEIVVHIGESTMLIDHTACENLMHYVEQIRESGIPIKVEGLGKMRRLSEHHACVHVSHPSLAVS